MGKNQIIDKMDRLKIIFSKVCIHKLFRRIIFLIMAVLTCLIAPHVSAQIITVKGTIYSTEDSTTIPFATILIHDSTGHQLSGSMSDFDGNFTIKFNAPASGHLHISVTFTCHYEVTLDSVRCENTDLNIYLKPIPCPAKTQADCPTHSDECEVVPIEYTTMFEKPSKIRRNNKTGDVYIKQYYNEGSECCPKQWYCKKHQVEF